MYYEDDDIHCGFYLIIDIVAKKTGAVLNIRDIKNDLLEEYTTYGNKYSNQIIDILILEGKKSQGVQVKQKKLSFHDFVLSEDYFITNLDLWLLMNKYKIPSIIISTKPILLANKDKNAFALYGNLDSEFVIICSPTLRTETIPKYSYLASSPDKTMFHSLRSIHDEPTLQKLTESVENILPIETFLQSFTKKAVKKPVRLEIVEDDYVAGDVAGPKKQTRKQKKTNSLKCKTKKNYF
jgi:hypothetical protein